ncbi:Transforming growth factor beta-1-induced transcript 1 protein [Coemansia furcata]|uniref:Transforming growth factor beta-1-induced transcript 1 protein n=1 Tax=Coemansia furcata TaxID=417177 RepID=A0ACC1LK09_9FUNG|nr:Transforming growth factor beta-1-induced transcript 1 protein [Coemansia furcata]
MSDSKPPAKVSDVLDSDEEQSLAEALRSGDRDTIEAIVQKLTGQLESLKMESMSSSRAADFGLRQAAATNKTRLNEHRRISSLATANKPATSDAEDASSMSPAAAAAAKNRRKRATVAVGLLSGAETGIAAVVCAYCGLPLDEGSETATKATLNSEIGYCCSNCEGILSVAAPDDQQPPAAAGAQIIYHDADSDPAFMDDTTAAASVASAADANDGLRGEQTLASESGLQKSTGNCDQCHAPLGEEYVNILGRRFHVTHFACEDCGIPLYALGGYLQAPHGGEKFYCQRDYLQRFSPSCHACSVQITSGEMAVALGRTYHSDCFVCSICQSPFIGDVCYEHDSQPLCEWHWYIQNGLLCTECGGIIKNQCVLTRGKKYHQVCAESKYGESAITIEEARRQLKAAKSSAPQAPGTGAPTA